MRRVVIAIIGALALAGCAFNHDSPYLELDMREWYPSPDIVIPFKIWDSQPYAQFRYEYNAGSEWQVDIDRTFRIPQDDRGVIELVVPDPGFSNRVSFTTLVQPGPGQPLEAYSVTERYFRIDTTTPSVDTGSLLIIAYSNGVEAPGPTYDPWLNLEIEVTHAEFDAPSGSPVTIFVNLDGLLPTPENGEPEVLDGPRRFWIWGGNGGPYSRTVCFLVEDKAGNRSGVRTVVFESF